MLYELIVVKEPMSGAKLETQLDYWHFLYNIGVNKIITNVLHIQKQFEFCQFSVLFLFVLYVLSSSNRKGFIYFQSILESGMSKTILI